MSLRSVRSPAEVIADAKKPRKAPVGKGAKVATAVVSPPALVAPGYRDDVMRALVLAGAHTGGGASNDALAIAAATEGSAMLSIAQPTIYTGIREAIQQ